MPSKTNARKYTYSDFAQTQDAATQRLLHHAQDHMLASRTLRANPIFLDTAAYICNVAFELLLKSMHLAEHGDYEGIHNIVELHSKLTKKIIAKKDIPLLKVIDKYNLIRYPIDRYLHSRQTKLRLGRRSFFLDEIGTEELKKADDLFFKLWRKLQRLKQYKPLIENIHKNPYKKGNRILMRKPRLKNQI